MIDSKIKDYLSNIGKKGGKTTNQKHPNHLKNISQLGVEARRKKKVFS